MPNAIFKFAPVNIEWEGAEISLDQALALQKAIMFRLKRIAADELANYLSTVANIEVEVKNEG